MDNATVSFEAVAKMKTVALLCDGYFILIFSVFFYAFTC